MTEAINKSMQLTEHLIFEYFNKMNDNDFNKLPVIKVSQDIYSFIKATALTYTDKEKTFYLIGTYFVKVELKT